MLIYNKKNLLQSTTYEFTKFTEKINKRIEMAVELCTYHTATHYEMLGYFKTPSRI